MLFVSISLFLVCTMILLATTGNQFHGPFSTEPKHTMNCNDYDYEKYVDRQYLKNRIAVGVMVSINSICIIYWVVLFCLKLIHQQ